MWFTSGKVERIRNADARHKPMDPGFTTLVSVVKLDAGIAVKVSGRRENFAL
jgi:hypothetical protein